MRAISRPTASRGASLCLALLLSACGGGGEMSLPDYVERINAIMSRAAQQYESHVASPQGEVLAAEAAQLTDFTPQDLQAALERVRVIEIEVREAVQAIEPPEQVADLHYFLFDFSLSIQIEEALAARAGTAADWEELSESSEMAAHRAQLATDKQACTDLQSQLDAIADRGAFGITAWIPGEVEEVVEAVLGCGGFPEHPENVFRPPPSSIP